MKKQLLLFYLCITILPALAYEVGTDIRQKNVLLEEFTGIHCGYCPQGHAIARDLLRAQPSCMYVIAVHSGPYAIPGSDEPDFRTSYGEMIDSELKPDSYPSGAVNRHSFAGTYTSGRNFWTSNCKIIREETAPVNLYMYAELDGSTRELNIRIEGYYTQAVNEPFHLLNVALLQNNIKGPQNGSGVGSDYIHQHMLRDLITGQWGDTIITPRQGEYFEREYVYKVPVAYKSTEVELGEIELVVFICRNKKDVLNVTGGKPEYKNYSRPLNAAFTLLDGSLGSRYAYNYFSAKIRNLSSEILSTAVFDVLINGVTGMCEWEGEISPFGEKTVTVRFPEYEPAEKNSYKIRLVSLNGAVFDGNSVSGEFAGPVEACCTITTEIQTDLNAGENGFYIKDRDGNIVKEFGPYSDGEKSVYRDTVELAEGIYCFEITDKWGDGIQEPPGYYKLRNSDQTLLAQNYAIAGFGEKFFFNAVCTGAAVHETESFPTKSRVWTDLTTGNIVIAVYGTVNGSGKAEIYSLTGKTVMKESIPLSTGSVTKKKISFAKFERGIYLVKICQGEKNEILKLVVK